jgi:ribose transport system ATP-binding protein
MAEPLMEARDLAKSFGPVIALRSAEVVVEPGEVHALLGANGAGKSTLVKILTGVLQADGGSIKVNGDAVRVRSPAQAARIGLAPVFQDPALVPDLTVADNLHLTGSDLTAVRQELAAMELSVDFRELVGDVSLPMLRMIDLARALARRPQLLLLDEITAALPSDLAERVFAAMRAQREQGRSVLFITHRLNEVIQTCDRATILRDGSAVARIVPEEGSEETIVAHMLGEAVARAAAEATAHKAPVPAAPIADAVPALEVDALTVAGVNDVSFSLAAGEVLGIAALEGQGQDELFDALAGSTSFTSGEIRVVGRRLKARHPYDAIRAGVVLVPADRLHALLPQR